MACRVYVSESNLVELSPFHRFSRPLPGVVGATSILGAMAYLLARQHGKQGLAKELSTMSPDDIEDALRRHGVGQMASELFVKTDVLRAVLCDQARYEPSPVHVALNKASEGVPAENGYPRFVVCDAAEFVFSCGLSEANAREASFFPGANLWGECLESAYRVVRGGQGPPSEVSVLFLDQPGSLRLREDTWKSVLWLSDSIGKPLLEVVGGPEPVKVSGGTFRDIVRHLESLTFEQLSCTHGLFIQCGVNLVQYARNPEKARFVEPQCAEFVRCMGLIRERCPDLVVRVSLAIPHESLADIDVPAFNEGLKSDLESLGVTVFAWHNAFPFFKDGVRDASLYDSDGFHLNELGFRFLWRMLTKNTKFQAVPIVVREKMSLQVVAYPASPESRSEMGEGAPDVLVVDGNNNDERVVEGSDSENEEDWEKMAKEPTLPSSFYSD